MIENKHSLQGMTIMITGASSGIGAAAARLFAADGARVVLVARREELLKSCARRIEEDGGQAVVAPGDVRSAEQMRRIVEDTVAGYGRLDAAFNHAGYSSSGTALHLVPDEEFDTIMDTNVRGVWNCLRPQIAAMLASGGGAVVNTASVAAVASGKVAAPYIASKNAVVGLTRAAAAEYGAYGIRVNALVVGSANPELVRRAGSGSPAAQQGAAGAAEGQRFAEPEQAAAAARWLCSPASSFMTGASVPVDGGWPAM
jgi:NAD(P)-dependent dehydrogenase (short-subunit alcohol dehydrogenase family)